MHVKIVYYAVTIQDLTDGKKKIKTEKKKKLKSDV